MEIRAATVDDVPELLALWGQSRSALPEGAQARLEAAILVGEPEVVVARLNERAVAFLVMRQSPLNVLSGATAVCMDEFFVAAAERRHGVGRALLAYVAAQAERLGAEQIVAGVPSPSKDAQRYFAKLGFVPVVVRRATTPPALLRRLAGSDGQRGSLENLLSRRRSLRARSRVV
nr:GNAT family N-acetyltransferase [Kineosporia rhizophila]